MISLSCGLHGISEKFLASPSCSPSTMPMLTFITMLGLCSVDMDLVLQSSCRQITSEAVPIGIFRTGHPHKLCHGMRSSNCVIGEFILDRTAAATGY